MDSSISIVPALQDIPTQEDWKYYRDDISMQYIDADMSLDDLITRMMDPVVPIVPALQDIPTEEDWNYYRDLITMLYIDADMRLEDLMTTMEDTYSFRATIQMYKKRFKKWSLRKNLKAREKEALAAQMPAIIPATCLRLPFHDQRIKHRVDRYRKQVQAPNFLGQPKALQAARKFGGCLSQQPHQTAADARRRWTSDNSYASSLSWRLPSLHPRAAAHLCSLLQAAALEEFNTRRQIGAAAVFDGRPLMAAYDAIVCNLRRGCFVEARESFGYLCDELGKLHPWTYAWVVGCVSCVVHEPGWADFSDFRTKLLSFFHAWYELKLGPLHKLTSSLLIMRDVEVTREASLMFQDWVDLMEHTCDEMGTFRNGTIKIEHRVF